MSSKPAHHSSAGAPLSAGHLIGLISRRSQCYFDQQFARLGLSSGTFLILLVLAHHNEISQNGLSRLLTLDKANIARGVKKLIDRDYVNRRVDNTDKRAYQLTLTPKGEALLPDIRCTIGGWNDMLTDGFSDEEKKQAVDLLNRMSGNTRIK